MDFKQKIAGLNLPQNSYIVVGSGILGALGIRESNDIDLIVTEQAYRYVETLGWEKDSWGGNTVVFKKDVFDIGNDWYGKTAEDLLQHAEIVDEVPYLSLNDVYEWKKTKARDKDLRDLKLIDEYRAGHSF